MTTAVAYYRTSSATNVGADKDSLTRQKQAVASCALSKGVEIVAEYYDAAVSGADPVDSRAGFAAMLERVLSNGCRTIIVENASRFARDLIVQETGYAMLTARGITLIAADSPDSFVSDTPTAVMVRQILGAVSQFEKSMLVNKLRAARDRKSAALGRRVEGNPHWKPVPIEHVKAAQAARARGLSLRQVAQELEALAGKLYGANSVKKMLAKPVQS